VAVDVALTLLENRFIDKRLDQQAERLARLNAQFITALADR
jgi:hypothetical protein